MEQAESLAKQSPFQINTEIEYCPKCDYPKDGCRCEEIAEEAEKMRQMAKLREIQALGGERAAEHYTLKRFDNKQAIAECDCFPKRGLFIYGPVGCGKTHLAVAIVRKFKDAKVLRTTDFLRNMRACNGAAGELAYLKTLLYCPLVIDDIGAEKISDYSLTSLWELIDRRWQNLNPAIIITSNLGRDALVEKFGEDRIISRIAGMCKTIKLDGEDRRLC